MGKKAREVRKETKRSIRTKPLSSAERALLATATYEGSAFHKRAPNDFGLTPPYNPHPDKTHCDEAGIVSQAQVKPLLAKAIERGLVSEATTGQGYPKQFWVVDGEWVYELMYGGNKPSDYHGYPVRENDPLHSEVRAAWGPV